MTQYDDTTRSLLMRTSTNIYNTNYGLYTSIQYEDGETNFVYTIRLSKGRRDYEIFRTTNFDNAIKEFISISAGLQIYNILGDLIGVAPDLT